MRLMIATLVGSAVLAALATDRGAVPARFAFGDTFDRGLCVGSCPGAVWAVRQEERGAVSLVSAPGRSGKALRARAEAKRGSVSKAALIARPGDMPEGTQLTVAFDLYVPRRAPVNSLQLVDIECARCGEGGNPGIRLYLRRGRLRIDRSKIGIEHAWTRDTAPQITRERWHRIVWTTRLARGQAGRADVALDGRNVLSGQGATLAHDRADRVQIGITANSNHTPATALFDNVRVTANP